ncbi:hypothetical protein M8C21_014767 [Ambrosia artemisiifolia]|uniref:RING-type domain-containing protein n=1 Tax=Ambrosia artemisiifolia TaxID=4212 RepID=A0AAD5D0F3_AMBAR|nr:hypothetical protein M8C21_014767 [Ambrosia artemisiifolia]
MAAESDNRCLICEQFSQALVTITCGHNCCRECFKKRINKGHSTCAICCANLRLQNSSRPPMDERDKHRRDRKRCLLRVGLDRQCNEDHGDWFIYTGKYDSQNEALRAGCETGYPVLVTRFSGSRCGPKRGFRCDGLYKIMKCWMKSGIQGSAAWRYLFVRCDNEPANWTRSKYGDSPRPLPTIDELKDVVDVIESKGPSSWDYDEEKGCWLWKVQATQEQINPYDVKDNTKKRVAQPRMKRKLTSDDI